MGEMKAKFAGTCRVCKEPFPQDTRILWSRTDGTRHVPQECGQRPELAVDPDAPRLMNAAFDGRCKNCSEPVYVGDAILYVKEVGAFHADCEPVAVPKPERVYAGGVVPEPVVPNGHYTVMLGAADSRVYVQLKDGFSDGEQIVAIDFPEAQRRELSDVLRWDSRWVGFGTVDGQDLTVWKRFTGRVPEPYLQAVRALLTGSQWTQYGEAFAEEFQVCYRCASDLSAPASLCRGVGPTCAKYLGIEIDKAAIDAWMREHPVEALVGAEA